MANDAGKCRTPHVLYNRETGEVQVIPCNSWQCETCCKLKSWWLSVRLHGGIKRWFQEKDMEDWQKIKVTMLILTIVDMNTDIMAAWHVFLTNMRDKGYLKDYAWVKEFQERGARHLHIVCFGWLPKDEVDHFWSHHGYSWVSAVPQNKAGYITKYLAKSKAQELFEHGERRYGCSRGFLVPLYKPEPTGEWAFFTYSQWNDREKQGYDDHRVENGYVPNHGKLCPEYVFRVKPIGDPWSYELEKWKSISSKVCI